MISFRANSSATARHAPWALAAVGLLVAQVWLWPTVRAAADTWRVARSVGEQHEQVRARLQGLDQQVQERRRQQEALKAVTPPTAGLPALVGRLEALADQQGVGLTLAEIEEQPLGIAELADVHMVTIEGQIAGSLGRVLGYLAAVEHLDALAVVGSWNLAPVPQPAEATVSGEAAEADFTLALSVSFILQPQGDDDAGRP